MIDFPYRLKVQQIEQVCLFELTWGQGQHLTATLNYPTALTQLYQEWQQVYISFYTTTQTLPSATIPTPPNNSMRGRVVGEAKLSASTIDLHAKLVQSEALLLHEFQRWLRDAELYEIREAIAYASRESAKSDRQGVDVFLTCMPLELARLPWESWEICTDFTGTGGTRIVRAPVNIPGKPSFYSKNSRRKRARILAIMGNGRGLNLQTDQEIIQSLRQKADVEFVRWEPTESPADIKNKIRQALTDAKGWDGLFFSGHSNETQVTGGELAIAPGSSIQISEITHELTIAEQRGLQFAIFNSCSGIKVAESLIKLGISQVVIMREPIHNSVAQELLVEFTHGLSEYKDVQESLISAYKFLRLEKKFTYPSAYLVPSLYYHPGATLFRLQPSEPIWKKLGRNLMPTRLEAIALLTSMVLLGAPWVHKALLIPSSAPAVQEFMLDRRLWVQAVYRNLTGKIPSGDQPPVTLIQIDEKSIRRSNLITDPNPINRQYLAELVQALVPLQAKVVGIDYLFDEPQEGDKDFGEVVKNVVNSQKTWFVFAADYKSEEGEVGIYGPESGIHLEWSLQAAADGDLFNMSLLDPTDDCREVCPFSYLLSLIFTFQHSPNATSLQPNVSSSLNLRTQLLDTLEQKNAQNQEELAYLQKLRMPQAQVWSRENLGQRWLQPIIDYSIPPNQVYNRVAAWELHEGVLFPTSPNNLSNQIVIIAQGGYSEAGVKETGGYDRVPDSHSLPLATNYWRPYASKLTGAEIIAYEIYQLLNQHLVILVPDLWMIGIAVIVGKATAILITWRCREKRNYKRRIKFSAVLFSAIALYGLIGLELFVSTSILLPFALPSSMFLVYALPTALRKKHAST
jgi:CHASE2 domain-containing sensor protein